jgi:hypothetical protein
LLSIGNESLYHEDHSPLVWWECFRFIYDYQDVHRSERLIGFFLGFDFGQILKSLPEDRARMLYTDRGRAARTPKTQRRQPFPVRAWGGGCEWEFDLLPNGRRLKLRPRGASRWATVMDCGSFWQTSLLQVIDPENWPEPIVSDSEYEIIAEGKSARGGPDPDDAVTRRYNVTENLALARAMGVLETGLESVGVRLSREKWFGPGQASQAWLLQQGAPLCEDILAALPDDIATQLYASYYGGRFEIPTHGTIPRAIEYDLVNAYAWYLSQAPCPLHGEWTTGTDPQDIPTSGYTLLTGTFRGDDARLGGLPWRDSHGLICYPQATRGTYWAHEVQAAVRAGLINDIELERWDSYSPCNCPPPYRGLVELYHLRAQMGKRTPVGIAAKLVMNACYGKMVQSIGYPKVHNMMAGSLTTSLCRTAILDAIATHPTRTDNLLMIATDGVYFAEPHPNLSVTGNFGEWEEKALTNLTLFKPGVYWHGDRERMLKVKSRGVNARALHDSINELDSQFESFRPGDPWPKTTLTVPFAMTSPRQALARGKWETCGELHHDIPVVQSSDPTQKRATASLTAYRGGWQSTAYARRETLQSAPYDPLTMDTVRSDQDLVAPLAPTDPITEIHEILRG